MVPQGPLVARAGRTARVAQPACACASSGARRCADLAGRHRVRVGPDPGASADRGKPRRDAVARPMSFGRAGAFTSDRARPRGDDHGRGCRLARGASSARRFGGGRRDGGVRRVVRCAALPDHLSGVDRGVDLGSHALHAGRNVVRGCRGADTVRQPPGSDDRVDCTNLAPCRVARPGDGREQQPWDAQHSQSPGRTRRRRRRNRPPQWCR
jgi:hypothetical protein